VTANAALEKYKMHARMQQRSRLLRLRLLQREINAVVAA
jgi:hypothetical protein